MKQHNSAVIKKDAAQFEKWCFQQTVERHQRELEFQKRKFEMEKNLEQERMKREQHLFDMKWKILESELQKLAAEKQKMERQRDFYSRVHEFEQENRSQSSNVVKGEMFFMGVGNEKSLRKRYKDLIKIYHPDNLNGDTGTIQEINREYQVLMQKLEVKYQ